jgi:hypothetical protein
MLLDSVPEFPLPAGRFSLAIGIVIKKSLAEKASYPNLQQGFLFLHVNKWPALE